MKETGGKEKESGEEEERGHRYLLRRLPDIHLRPRGRIQLREGQKEERRRRGRERWDTSEEGRGGRGSGKSGKGVLTTTGAGGLETGGGDALGVATKPGAEAAGIHMVTRTVESNKRARTPRTYQNTVVNRVCDTPCDS